MYLYFKVIRGPQVQSECNNAPSKLAWRNSTESPTSIANVLVSVRPFQPTYSTSYLLWKRYEKENECECTKQISMTKFVRKPNIDCECSGQCEAPLHFYFGKGTERLNCVFIGRKLVSWTLDNELMDNQSFREQDKAAKTFQMIIRSWSKNLESVWTFHGQRWIGKRIAKCDFLKWRQQCLAKEAEQNVHRNVSAWFTYVHVLSSFAVLHTLGP
jgi:hypothetical protein